MADQKSKSYDLRASIPAVLRYVGLGGVVIALLAVGLGFYIATTKNEFRGKDFPAELSENLIGIVNGYQRKETENGKLKYFIKADVAKTFDDNHQELENISLHLYKDGDELVFDKIKADKAIYLPVSNSKEFTVYFAGNVEVFTHHELQVKTDQLNYNSSTGIARAEEAMEFSRHNISGKSYGAIVNINEKTLELQKDVEIISVGAGRDGAKDLKLRRALIRSGSAFVDGTGEIIRLSQNVSIALTPETGSDLKQPTDITAQNAVVYFKDREVKKVDLDGNVFVKQDPTAGDNSWLHVRARHAVVLVDKTVEHLDLIDNVVIDSKSGQSAPVNLKSNRASYTRIGELFELTDNVQIVTKKEGDTFRAVSATAIYRQASRNVLLQGGAEVSQGGDLVRGDSIKADLTIDNDLKFAKAEENAYLKQTKAGRVTEANSATMSAWFGNNKNISKAEARGQTRINVIPSTKGEFARFKMATPGGLDIAFNGNGSLNSLTTIGRTTLHLDAGTNQSSASDRTLVADTINTAFRPDGNELAAAHAIGNAELVVVPKSSEGGIYSSKVNSPRFDCDFYSGNNARKCTSVKRSKLVRNAVNDKSPQQTLEADKLDTVFEEKTRNVRIFEAAGRARFSEGDRNGSAGRIVYFPEDGLVRLRESTPTVWDSRARAKADSIDWNTKDGKSLLTGGVSTTYYDQQKTGGATPFNAAGAPVYITSDSAKFDHNAKSAVYLGNARAWQEKNYVKGDSLYLEEATGRLFAEGNVQSVLYDAERTTGGKKSTIPVFVSAGTMLYQKDTNQLKYERNVDIRQGPDRIVGRTADVFLTSDNSLSSTVVVGDVVITQPNRKATGDYARYDAVNETVLLRGDPAVFNDSEQGTTSGKVVNVDLKNRSAVNSGGNSPTDGGRIRSVYKVKGGRVN